MATTLTPSAGSDYQQYKRSVDEITEDYDRQLSRLKEKNERELNSVREQTALERQKAREDADRTVSESKEAMNETVARDRELNRREVERMRAQMYDKFGRYNGQEADSLRSQLDSTREAMEQQSRQDLAKLKETERTYQERLRATNEDKLSSVEDAVQTYRDSISEQSEYAARARRENEIQARNESQERYRRLDEQRVAEQDQMHKHLKESVEKMETGFNRKISELERSEGERGLKIRDALRQTAEEAVRRQNESHAREIKDVREKMGDLMDVDRIQKKALGDRIEEFERDTRRDYDKEKARLVADRDETVQHERTRSEQAEEHARDTNREAVKRRDEYYSSLIREKEQDHHQREVDQKEVFERSMSETDNRARKEREQASAVLERQAEKAGRDREEAMVKQAKTYQDAGSRERKAMQGELSQLQRELQTRKTSTDPSDISPAAEATVRNTVTREYEDKFLKSEERHSATVDSIQENYSTRLQETLVEREARETDRNRMLAYEHHRERADLLNQIDDTENRKLTALRDSETMHERDREKLMKNYTSQMERQRRQYEEMLQTARYDSSAKLQMTRREHELQMKTAHRSFMAQQNELIREYDKRLSDQRLDLEARITDVKATGDSALREAERKHRQTVDELSKNYENRIAQMEQQQKERERAQIASYEDQLDRMRRAHAISTKKG